MSGPDRYSTATAVDSAIKQAARSAYIADPSLSISERIRAEYFNRFLSRTFSEGAESEWLLKGGLGLLARVPSARATRDIDLYRTGYSLDDALNDLRRLAEVDLNDHFEFIYAGHETAVAGDQQPYTDGYTVKFDVYLGTMKKQTISIDLTVGAGKTDTVTITPLANRLNLPKIESHDYRLYPIVDQIADKVCATMATYANGPSSREKDLVDLVILAVTQDIDGQALHRAIFAEIHRRGIEPFARFTVPPSWGRAYARMAVTVPHCAEFRDVSLASELAFKLVNPALATALEGKTWSHTQLDWS